MCWSATPRPTSRPGTIFVVQGDPANPAHLRASMPTAVAAQTPVEQSMQALGLAAQQQVEPQAQEMQNPTPRMG